MRREFPDIPLVGVGAVIIENNRVLLVKRGHPPLLGEWSIPGGVLEVGEMLRDAAVREARRPNPVRRPVPPARRRAPRLLGRARGPRAGAATAARLPRLRLARGALRQETLLNDTFEVIRRGFSAVNRYTESGNT